MAGELFLRGDFAGHMGSEPTVTNPSEPDVWNESPDAMTDSMY